MNFYQQDNARKKKDFEEQLTFEDVVKEKETMFKVWVKGVGETTYATNGLDFETVEAAKTWGNDLMSRWFGAESFLVLPKDDRFTGFLDADTALFNAKE